MYVDREAAKQIHESLTRMANIIESGGVGPGDVARCLRDCASNITQFAKKYEHDIDTPVRIFAYRKMLFGEYYEFYELLDVKGVSIAVLYDAEQAEQVAAMINGGQEENKGGASIGSFKVS